MRNHHIMVIEDDPVTLEYMEELLSLYGFQVTPWNTSVRAVEQVVRSRPDLVILDQRLDGEVDGLKILEALHHEVAASHIPVILYSAENEFLRRHRSEVQAMGGEILSKPFMPDELLEMIREMIEVPKP